MKKFFAMALVALALTSCGAVKSPVFGGLYSDVKDGLAVTSNTGSTKVGTASATSYLGIVALGDASIQAAAKSANIKKIQHVDYQAKSILGIVSTYTIYVYGE